MIYVLDASAGVEIALNRQKSKVFIEELSKASKIITSDLYKAGTTNVLWKYHKAGLLSKEDALRTLQYCENLIDEYVNLSLNSQETLVEAMRLGHSAYDIFYLTIARRNGGILVTMDKRLMTLAIENGIEIPKVCTS
jgi:predicted nucleic acid-binding protein